ncbi:MAG: hypothetical protein UT50_C0001G0003 [Candidatus Moranbacteria bacterium GW2011_GWA2_39_41]|nr:MAG: hypothetical protein UT50_C0001G0003 [Candidatus Moranbacteria bacterium GW2011_GWA2_39_41]
MKIAKVYLVLLLACLIAEVSVVSAGGLFTVIKEDEAFVADIFRKRALRSAKVVTPASVPTAQTQVNESTRTTAMPVVNVTASQSVAKSAMTAPPSGNEKKLGHFHEVSAVAGYTHGINSGVKGIWGMAEYIRWQERESGNFGLGATAKTWYGSGDTWHNGRVEIGPNIDWYQQVGLDNAVLLKLRPLYRFGQTENGFAPGAYLEFDHIIGRNDTLFGALDVSYFPGDTYLGLSLMNEHRFNRDWRLQYGVNFMEQIGESESVFGFGPAATLKYQNWKLGLSYTFLPGSPVFGISLGYEYNSYLRQWDADKREKSMKQEVVGQTVSMPAPQAEVQLAKSTGGNAYVTLPATQNTVGATITFADNTFEEEKRR